MIPANQVITSLAILLVNWAEGKSYIDNFVPFIGQCIVTLKPEVVSIQELQDKMLNEYGLLIPQNSLKSILKKAVRKGYFKRQDNAYIPDYEALKDLDIDTAIQQFIRQHNAIIQKFIQFASERYNESLRTEEAEEILLSYIKQHDIELLTFLITGEAIPETETKLDRKQSYLIQVFVKYIYESDPEGFKYLDAIVKGHMLSNALIFPDLGAVQRRFRQTSVYCDTALILRTLGYEGHSRQIPCRELMELLYGVGANICCFRHTRDEIFNILYACKMDLSQPDTPQKRSPVFQYFLDSGLRPADLDLEIALLDKNIERRDIKIVEKPETIEKYQIDESCLDAALAYEFRYGSYGDKARAHDVDCLSAVYRLRSGQSSSSIEECGALFATPNNLLCRVSKGFFIKEDYIREWSVPIAITDYALTTILWLKKPMATPDLPQKYVIAECYAAMEPGEHLWRKYLDKILQLKDREDISEDEYYLLRYTYEARTELTDITMSDDETFVDGTVQEILGRVRQNMRDQDLTELAWERQKLKETERKLHLEQTRSREKEEIRTLNIDRKSWRIAFVISILVFSILGAFLISGAVYGLLGPWLRWWNPFLFVAAIFFVLFSLYNLFFRTTVKDWFNRFENLLASRIQRALRVWFVP